MALFASLKNHPLVSFQGGPSRQMCTQSLLVYILMQSFQVSIPARHPHVSIRDVVVTRIDLFMFIKWKLAQGAPDEDRDRDWDWVWEVDWITMPNFFTLFFWHQSSCVCMHAYICFYFPFPFGHVGEAPPKFSNSHFLEFPIQEKALGVVG